MNTTAKIVPVSEQLWEDPLSYLPCSPVLKFPKGQTIYSPDQPSTSIYLVIGGTVKVCRMAGDGRQVLVDIYRPDDFFGESSLVGLQQGNEVALALENTELMMWTSTEIEDIGTRRPRLAIALLQFAVRRSIDFGNRIESFSSDNISRRLARTLIRFSERLGRQTGDGSVHTGPFSHELLSQYVGTSREAVTLYMNQFRRWGYVQYSRHGYVLNVDAIKDWLDQHHNENIFPEKAVAA